MTVGMLDWGIGGISVLAELHKRWPNCSCIYLSDAGAKPYGKMTSANLTKRLNQIAKFFRNRNIKQIIIACNAASTVLVKLQKQNPDLTFYGMLDSGVEMIKSAEVKSCLVIGGKRTIQSGYFQKKFKSYEINRRKIKIETKIAQPFSAFIERGDMTSKQFNESLQVVFSDLKTKPESILLACTHYPAIQKQIDQYFKSNYDKVKILNPALFVVKKFLKSTSKIERDLISGKKNLFYTTGSASEMKKSSAAAFKFTIKRVQKIHL
jgi:glutamate racemase